MTQQRQRRRPMSREEARAMEERRQRQKEKEQESRELARGPIDLPFLVLVLLLTGIGLVMLLSASFPSAYYETDGKNPMFYFMRQGVFAAMGLAAMLLIGKINSQRFRGLAQPLLFLSIILLVLVLIPHNPIAITRNNATRWLVIPGTSLQFQPSEVAKVAVVVYFADSISKKKDRMRTFRYGILPYAIILVVLAALGFAFDMPLILIFVGIIYIAETMSDIIQVTYFKATHGKRFFKMAPLHHHLELSGWSEAKLVAVFSGITLVFCALAFLGIQGRL